MTLRAGGIAATLTLLAAVTAAIVALTAAGAAREWLDFGFGGIPNRLGEVSAVLLNNLRLLGGLLAAAVLTQLVRQTTDAGLAYAYMRVLTIACDLLVAASVALHVALVGAAVGAYGGRAVAALLPHGPVELAAFSLGLSIYLGTRRGALDVRRCVQPAVLAAAALVVAAFLEVYAG